MLGSARAAVLDRARVRVGLVLLILLSELGLGRRAYGAAVIDFSLDYDKSPGCPSAAEFEAALVARLPAAERVPASQGVARLRVRLRSSDTGEQSQIYVDLPNGTSLRRELPVASCSEALSSMAVIAAMALEGNPDATSEQQPVATPGSSPRVEPVSAPPIPTPRASSTSPTTLVKSGAPRPALRAPGFRWSALALGGLESGTAPRGAPVATLGIELSAPGTSPLAPVVRASGLLSRRSSDVLSVPDTSATFSWFAARLEACPKGLEVAPWALTACALGEYGSLHGSASGVEREQDRSMRWFGGGLGVHARFELSRVVAVQVAASGRALAVHDRFIFNPAEPVYQVPAIAGDLLIGLSASWH